MAGGIPRATYSTQVGANQQHAYNVERIMLCTEAVRMYLIYYN